MGYSVQVSCDKCGDGFVWENRTVGITTVVMIVRDKGWSYGKKGFICPLCRMKKVKSRLRKDD